MASEPVKFWYRGPHDAVYVPALGKTVKRDHQVEVADPDVIASFRAQADWKEVGGQAVEDDTTETEEDKVIKGG